MNLVVKSERHGRVTVVRMCSGENFLSTKLLGELHDALDEVESEQCVATPGPVVLIGEGDFFCAGFDLDWMQRSNHAGRVLPDLHLLLKRLLTFPAVTFAVINGHA